MEPLSEQMNKFPTDEMAIAVLIVDDNSMFRQGLTSMLANQSDILVAGEAACGEDAVKLAVQLAPDIILMEIALPDFSGVEAARKILKAVPTVRVIALSMHNGREYIHRMMKCGASGYLIKDCEFEELVQAIRAVHQGKSYLCSGAARVVIDTYVRGDDNHSSSILTDREREVLQSIADGLSTKKIADELNVSPKTVITHRRQIMRKLKIFNVAELTKYAVREGLSSL